MNQIYPFCKTIFLFLLLAVSCTAIRAQACTPQGDETTPGSNNVWRGYVYQGRTFNTYKGFVTEGNATNPNFDQNFGGDQVNYATNGCSIYTDDFSVRYKLTKTFANADYTITVGADDGVRLSIDGGVTWLIDNWGDHSYYTSTNIIRLNGTYNLVLEYYEAYGGNRVSFSIAQECLGDGDPSVYGTGNIWRAYLYQGKNFDVYKGYRTEGTSINPNFDESFGGPYVNYATSNCSIYTENFSARYRLQKTLPLGTYIFTIGGDDGYRLSLDGGNTWVIDKWQDQGYNITSYTAVLSGLRNIVLEYYENGGENRISFDMNSSNTLPVTLRSWSATQLSTGKTQLNWKITDAVNFDHFLVQRSTNGQNFESIQTIAAINGNSSAEQSYTTIDPVLFSSTVYYRLAMVDKDGTTKYSSILTVNANSNSTAVKIYPTIVQNNNVYIETSSRNSNGVIELFDMNGRLLQTENYVSGGRRQFTLKGANTAGAYLLRVRAGNEILAKQTLLVQ